MKKKENNLSAKHPLSDLDIIDLDMETVYTDDDPEYSRNPSGGSGAKNRSEEEEFPQLSELAEEDGEFEESDKGGVYDEEDVIEEDFEEEERTKEGSRWIENFKKSRHFIFVLLVLLLVFLIVDRIRNYGVRIDLDDYEGSDDLLDVLDSIIPLIPEEGWEAEDDDGVTTIVFMGNNPFADDWDSEDNLVNMVAEMTGATVYNCSVEGSYLCASTKSLYELEDPMEAFNFYWLTYVLCFRGLDHVYDNIFETYADELPEHAMEAYNSLSSIDFSTVDVIAIMYDASDYLAGNTTTNTSDSTDIATFTGNLEAGIELIQRELPHIRIIVMSPTYAYAVDENGNYVSSDVYRYGEDPLSYYAILEGQSCYVRLVSFVDNLYGTIHEDIASDYLADNLHLNVAGRKLVAERFVYALTLFD